MIVQCLICGGTNEIPAWARLAEECKVHPEHRKAYICPSCQVLLECDAHRAERAHDGEDLMEVGRCRATAYDRRRLLGCPWSPQTRERGVPLWSRIVGRL